MSAKTPYRQDPLVNASGEANGPSRKDIPASCRSCLGTFKPKNRLNRFCSSRCRLRAWALDDLGQALATCKADGLRDRIRELGGTA